MPKVGDKFLGTVVKTAAFGAFVSLLPGRDGLLHISKVGDGKRVDKVEDFLNVGDKVEVRDRRDRRPRQDLPGQGAPGGRRGAGRGGRRRPAGRRVTGATVVRATAATGVTGGGDRATAASVAASAATAARAASRVAAQPATAPAGRQSTAPADDGAVGRRPRTAAP